MRERLQVGGAESESGEKEILIIVLVVISVTQNVEPCDPLNKGKIKKKKKEQKVKERK